ncbi:MAG: hypothetical protein K2K89_13825 [Ruminococcus sp.]|nr:hypothetical protein [Ruminococcus sp.]
MNNKGIMSLVKYLIIFAVIALIFATAINVCFEQLLLPNENINPKTLYQITNKYESETNMKENIYDKSNEAVYGNVLVNDSFQPVRTSYGQFTQITGENGLTKKERENINSMRLILDEDYQECWSNILPTWFGGFDSSLSVFLQDIPVNSEEETNIILTIDKDLQHATFDALADKNYASAFIMDISNGDVLSMVSKPSFRYNDYVLGNSVPFATYKMGGFSIDNMNYVVENMQAYYNSWEKSCTGSSPETTTAGWISDLLENSGICEEVSSEEMLKNINEKYGLNYFLSESISINFEKILNGEADIKNMVENNEQVTPFIKVTFPDTDNSYYFKCFYDTDIYPLNNLDNSHDCVQDYYKNWRSNCKGDNPEYNTSSWIAKSAHNGYIYNTSQATEVIEAMNKQYGSSYSLADCMTVDFDQIYNEETEFYKKNADNDNAFFEFKYEPDSILKTTGEKYTPFVKVKFADTDKEYYLKLFYGSNNFVYSDCVKVGFDPNFSATNFAVMPTPPGSSFKILMTALLADCSSESLIYDSANSYYDYDGESDINVSWNILSTGQQPLPKVETAHGYEYNTQQAIIDSSNEYFAVTAMLLDDIVNTTASSYECSWDRIQELCCENGSESLRNSGRILSDFYKSKFNIRSEIPSIYFNEKPIPSILGCLDNIDTTTAFDRNKHILYDSTLWYDTDENGELTQAHVANGINYAQKIGDTAYGQGYDNISPAYMAMVIGKCLTGNMYAPNIIEENSGKAEILGENFNRPLTVQIMREYLNKVYDYPEHYDYNNIVSDYTDFSQYTCFAKTGTASMEKGSGTQSTYGLFAEKAGYPSQVDNSSLYEVTWYTAAVSDGEHEYAIVIREFFGTAGSYALKQEFQKIVDALHYYGYLN